ncbi:ATP-binding cassette domain-containing protein [uncultured Granulicatella sp.]|jgi:lantibiotic transport ATP-binding protein srtF|uniref:ABC transporter ATP-binding protein n=1 Tax=uncultured Granulicatella sp. TaxID=316089 RepID=UPI0028D5E3AF|nr:ATP-binding cassette domain-containing protein [uncultured Granulicatella sp.]
MSKPLIEVKNIHKRYAKYHALDNVSFNIYEGRICGLIGENGAGKTTLIRIISGLIKQDSGEIVGLKGCKLSSIVESPALHLNLSAYDNLHYQLLLCGENPSHEKIEKVLNLVGLADVDPKKKAKDFSLGMRQRLAIGLAIIDSPKLLILDEPINGLDPKGIKDIRDILATLKNDFNITILISSHILSELDLIADDYVIMSKGKVIQEDSKAAILSSLANKIIVSTATNQTAIDILTANDCQCTLLPDKIEVNHTSLTINQIIDLLRENQIEIFEIYKEQVSFEEYYFNLVEGR